MYWIANVRMFVIAALGSVAGGSDWHVAGGKISRDGDVAVSAQRLAEDGSVPASCGLSGRVCGIYLRAPQNQLLDGLQGRGSRPLFTARFLGHRKLQVRHSGCFR